MTETAGRWGAEKQLRLVVWRVHDNGSTAVERDLDAGDWSPNHGVLALTRCLCFSCDGRLLACAVPGPNELSEIRMWDLSSGELRHTFKAPGIPFRSNCYCVFTPDGRRLITRGKVWDVKTGLELLTLTRDLVGSRERERDTPIFAYDGDVVHGVFASEDGIDVYGFDGTPPL
jgi:WD40 repeat protein